MANPQVLAFLTALPPDTRNLVETLLSVVRRNLPEAEETLLWGGISYHRPKVGGRVKGAVCQVEVKSGQICLGFIHGVRLADPGRLLCGNGVSKRLVPIKTVADAESPDLIALLREAATLDPRAA